jgi:hypothetical protein
MKIMIIGHPFRFGKVKDLVDASFSGIEAEFIEYYDYLDNDSVINTIKRKKDSVDALLFTGELGFKWLNPMCSDIIADYLYKDSGSFLKILIQAINGGYDISRISIDGFDKNLVNEAYEEIEFAKENINTYIYNKTEIEDCDYLEDIYQFHKNNFKVKKVSFCITAVSPMYKRLSSENIPCYLFQPTKDVIKNTLMKLQLKHTMQIKEYSQIVAISLEIDPPNEESVITEDEYQLMLENINVLKQVYVFAKRIQASVHQVENKGFVLFRTKQILESETDNLVRFCLFRMVNENTSSSISMGIGYGRTAMEARNNAGFSLMKAKKHGGNKAFIKYDSRKIVGPIDYLENSKSEIDSSKVDKKFLDIAEKCSISVNTVSKLNSISQQHKKDCFTPHELADNFGTSTRTIYRIIDKLEQQGFAKIVGKKIIADSGRPSRLIKLLF